MFQRVAFGAALAVSAAMFVFGGKSEDATAPSVAAAPVQAAPVVNEPPVTKLPPVKKGARRATGPSPPPPPRPKKHEATEALLKMTLPKFVERKLPLGSGYEPFSNVNARDVGGGGVRVIVPLSLCECGPIGGSIAQRGYSIVTRYPSDTAAAAAMEQGRLEALSVAVLKGDKPNTFWKPQVTTIDAPGMPEGSTTVEIQYGSRVNTLHIPESVVYLTFQQVGNVVTGVGMQGTNTFVHLVDLEPIVSLAAERVRNPIKTLPYLDPNGGGIVDPDGMI